MSRVLVTGGSGFIGTELVRAFRDSGHQVLNADLVEGLDILEPSTGMAIAKFDPELVFHLAALHYVPWCREHPTETTRTNVNGTMAVLEALGPSLRSFVLASSAAVYGFSEFPITEAHDLAPVDVYGETKVLAELALEGFAAERPDVACTAARLFNVVGAGDRNPHVVPSLARKVAAGSWIQVGNLWPKRDYVHVQDVVGALITLISFGHPVRLARYNVATGRGTSVEGLLEILRSLGQTVRLQDGAGPERRDIDGHLVADVTKTHTQTGWRATRSLESAVMDAIDEAAS